VMLLVLATIILTGTYNKKITGNASVFPHVLYTKLYTTVPICIWQQLYPSVHYNHKVLTDYVTKYAIIYYFEKRTWKGFVKDMRSDSYWVSTFFFGFPLAIPSLVMLLLFFFHRQTAARFWIAFLILLGTCASMTCSAKPHYFSPLTCLVVLLIIIGLRGLAGLKLHNVRVGSGWVILLIVFQLLLNLILTPIQPATRSLAWNIQSSKINLPSTFTREELKNILMKRGGKYLIVVKYTPRHCTFIEWVYNDADIDHSPIVWTRDMDEQHNKKLLEYFKYRQVLFINVYWDAHWDTRGFFQFAARQ
jgi:hypothetical protein